VLGICPDADLVWPIDNDPLASPAMGILTGAVVLPLIGATLHPLLGWGIQRTARAGVGMVLLVGLSNMLTVLVVLAYKRPEGSWYLSGYDWVAVANGVLFFFGQWYSMQSVRKGDLVVHSSVLGVKILVVALLSMGMGLEAGGGSLLAAVLLAAMAVFLVAGASVKGLKSHRLTVILTLIACLFFGVNDFLTGSYGSGVGTARWMTLMMGTAGLMSFVLVLSRLGQLRTLMTSGSAKWFVLLAGGCLGVQSVLVNVAFSEYQQPTLSNVAYSTRGVMAVIWMIVFGGVAGKAHWGRKIGGSGLMLVALWLALG
jgi:hypothetical protein